MKFNSIPELIADIKAGKLIILVDDEHRENEGDLVMAAECVTPDHINFMITHGRGLVCMPMSKARCEQLDLPLMVQPGPGRVQQTYFTVSIDAASGAATGISTYDRAHTIKTAAKKDAKPLDFIRPGHVFPIMAQPGGVLVRNGHTEASTDLAVLAGFEAAAVVVEILNEDGTMARRPELESIAKRFNLKIGSIADLVRYRQENQA
ncbi:MAG: 3,4-dihydroxy-2-butanone 4-phosphate synthase [Gammaproteobacteria bacterium]|jgi:3,4-dihydroxy 2-butanone 4-phosphate synthase/GTP cyclohydrolase II|nr:3,4-dihydroxy-2-butanone 4-phosphate synthase [Gammaproteobacteria bacterium]